MRAACMHVWNANQFVGTHSEHTPGYNTSIMTHAVTHGEFPAFGVWDMSKILDAHMMIAHALAYITLKPFTNAVS